MGERTSRRHIGSISDGVTAALLLAAPVLHILNGVLFVHCSIPGGYTRHRGLLSLGQRSSP